MKKIFTLLLTCMSLTIFGQSIDTSGGRYWNDLFTNVTITNNINFGSAVTYTGTTQNLSMDVYEPSGDTVAMRPLLIFAHGGSFISGTRNDLDVTTLCTRFAKMGYVCATIDYRLGIGLPVDSIHAGKALLRAMQDM